MSLSYALRTQAQRDEEARLAADEMWVHQQLAREKAQAEAGRIATAKALHANTEEIMSLLFDQLGRELLAPLEEYERIQKSEALSRSLAGKPPALEGIDDEDYEGAVEYLADEDDDE